jgi:DNA-binding response OmpR family regulator
MDKIKILMVDDEERFRTTTSKILSRKGFETLLADSGEQALEMLSQGPEVIVLDVRMGGMDGHETLEKIKAKLPKVPVIMLTGHGDVPGAKRAQETGAYDYLVKPCDIDLLAAKIQDAYAAQGKRLQESKLAGDIMIPLEDYTSISVNSPVKDAITALEQTMRRLVATDRLMDSGHRSVVVTNPDGSVAGILGPLDLVRAVLPEYLSALKPTLADSLQYSAMFWQGLFTSRVKEIMNRPVDDYMIEDFPTVEADANLMEACYAMASASARRMIVRRGGKDVGIVRAQELFYEIARIISQAG